MTQERTFVLIKPDGVQRALVGEIIARFEMKGLKLVALKMILVSDRLARKYYAEHVGKDFFPGLVEYVTSGPAVAMVLEGKGAVATVRALMGSTDPAEAQPGTIRGDLGVDISRNLIHGADSLQSAEREIALFFSPEELQDYSRIDDEWLYRP
ncbi:MAG: nucleoside-diphosphate kinase [Thermoplasmata archaeon]